MLSINLIPYAMGLTISPPSVVNDQIAEIIFDYGANTNTLAVFLRQIARGKYVYGSEMRLFRGKTISLEPLAGQDLYLDGELVTLPTDRIEIKILEKQLKVLG
jgi:diacylglycerol kinase family enzyme